MALVMIYQLLSHLQLDQYARQWMFLEAGIHWMEHRRILKTFRCRRPKLFENGFHCPREIGGPFWHRGGGPKVYKKLIKIKTWQILIPLKWALIACVYWIRTRILPQYSGPDEFHHIPSRKVMKVLRLFKAAWLGTFGRGDVGYCRSLSFRKWTSWPIVRPHLHIR